MEFLITSLTDTAQDELSLFPIHWLPLEGKNPFCLEYNPRTITSDPIRGRQGTSNLLAGAYHELSKLSNRRLKDEKQIMVYLAPLRRIKLMLIIPHFQSTTLSCFSGCHKWFLLKPIFDTPLPGCHVGLQLAPMVLSIMHLMDMSLPWFILTMNRWQIIMQTMGNFFMASCHSINILRSILNAPLNMLTSPEPSGISGNRK